PRDDLLSSLVQEAAVGRLDEDELMALTTFLFTGHAASAAHHALAVYSLAAHVAGAALWIGGLVALVSVAPDVRDRLPQIVGRYSGLALVTFAVVGASGAVNAWVRLGGVHLDSRYGALVVAKAAALAVLGAFGWWHRRATIPALRAGAGARAFVRLAAAEIIVMAAAMALATGLSRTPPPEVSPGTLDAVTLRLGFPLPGPASPRAYLLDWWIDPLFLVLVLTGAVLYGAGVLRVRRAGGPGWPAYRTLAWTAGLAVVLFGSCGGVARYSMVLFSAHAVQHVLVGLLGPLLLLRGAPLELARTALPSASMPDAVAGSRGARALTHPVVASSLLLLSLYAWYLSPAFGSSLTNHALHSLAMAGFLAIGLAYFAGTDGRVRTVLAAAPLHVAAGVLLVRADGVLGGSWYGGLGRAWG
ncbi:cytochrome c oxidase assembly protein, partial [Actinomadura fibrosa]|uniref:cytochrome c oxidase assembly protein n=1 Tax=Actinomadura fibrosa TaxID=111802 RepID=UPI001041A659